MTESRPTLYLVCGKIGSGKSTQAARLVGQHQVVGLSEDEWLATLYPGQITSLADYVRCTRRLREAIAPHVIQLLEHGISVVLDFQTSTPEARAWSRRIFEAACADHELHYLEASDELCKALLPNRNRSSTHQYQVSEADYELFTRYFVRPTPDEGFNILVHRQG